VGIRVAPVAPLKTLECLSATTEKHASGQDENRRKRQRGEKDGGEDSTVSACRDRAKQGTPLGRRDAAGVDGIGDGVARLRACVGFARCQQSALLPSRRNHRPCPDAGDEPFCRRDEPALFQLRQPFPLRRLFCAVDRRRLRLAGLDTIVAGAFASGLAGRGVVADGASRIRQVAPFRAGLDSSMWRGDSVARVFLGTASLRARRCHPRRFPACLFPAHVQHTPLATVDVPLAFADDPCPLSCGDGGRQRAAHGDGEFRGGFSDGGQVFRRPRPLADAPVALDMADIFSLAP